MIKLTLGQIASMNEIMGKIMEKPLPANMTFKIARLARELAKEIQTFEEARVKIAEKYGKKNENGGLYCRQSNIPYLLKPVGTI